MTSNFNISQCRRHHGDVYDVVDGDCLSSSRSSMNSTYRITYSVVTCTIRWGRRRGWPNGRTPVTMRVLLCAAARSRRMRRRRQNIAVVDGGVTHFRGKLRRGGCVCKTGIRIYATSVTKHKRESAAARIPTSQDAS
jgi:hypothetical protein